MAGENCWEAMNCGEEHCPARTEKKLDGTHGGKNAGRACWAVAGTRCGGQIQGVFAQKEGNCMQCHFYLQVRREVGVTSLKNGIQLLEIIHRVEEVA